MSVSRPTFTELVARIEADIAATFPQNSSRLRRMVLHALARVGAGIAHGLYGMIAWVAKQIIPSTADFYYLKLWASFWGVEWKARSRAHGYVDFAGMDGSLIAAGTLLQRGDGAEFTTDVDGEIIGGVATIAVTASVAAADGNTASGASLSLVSPIAGVLGVATVAAGSLAGGADDEKQDSLLARLEQRVQNPPEGGADHDYERWALEMPGVTRVWVFRAWLGAGTVGVAFVYDDREDIIPTPQDVADLQAYLEDPTRGPATADIIAFAPIPDPINPDITLSPDTASVRAAVIAELKDFLRRDAKPGGTLRLSRLDEAISIAANEDHHTLNAPVATIISAAGHMPVLGVPTWGA